MKGTFRLFGIIAIVAVIGFSFAACGDGNDGGNNSSGSGTWGNPPATLVGTWLTMGVSPGLVINANGTGTLVDDPVTSWKVKGSELKMTYNGVESIVKWSVSGDKLTIDYPSDTSTIGMGNLLITLSPLTKKTGNNNNEGEQPSKPVDPSNPGGEDTELDQARQDAISNLTDYVNGLNQSNYETANWTAIQNLKTQGINAINTATAANIPTVLASYKSQIAAVKTKDNGQQQGSNVQNIEFAKIPEKWTQNYCDGEVTPAINSALTQLANQSQALSQLPTDKWPSNLKDYWTIVQPDINAYCRDYTDVAYIKGVVSTNINGIIREMTSSMSSTDATTFTAQANAYRQANALAQREYVGFYENGYQVNPNAKPAQEAALLAQINGLGINATSVKDAIPLLKTALKNAPLPTEVKQQMDSILQQWEDFAQFDGWTQDINDIGYQDIINRLERPQQQQTRASIQAANGLVL